jgi:segregation and condensation protein B
MAELKEILEALIFVHRGVISSKVMSGILKDDYTPEEIDRAIQQLREDCARRGGVIELLEVAEGFEFGTRSDLAEWIQKMDHYEHHRHLSRPALETLAIIAYRQPVTRPEIESIRGVNVDGVVRTLLEKKLVRILGRKDVPGKPIVYGTTSEFLGHFGLPGLSALPSLREFLDESAVERDDLGERNEAALLPLEEGAGESAGEEGAESPVEDTVDASSGEVSEGEEATSEGG